MVQYKYATQNSKKLLFNYKIRISFAYCDRKKVWSWYVKIETV